MTIHEVTNLNDEIKEISEAARQVLDAMEHFDYGDGCYCSIAKLGKFCEEKGFSFGWYKVSRAQSELRKAKCIKRLGHAVLGNRNMPHWQTPETSEEFVKDCTNRRVYLPLSNSSIPNLQTPSPAQSDQSSMGSERSTGEDFYDAPWGGKQ